MTDTQTPPGETTDEAGLAIAATLLRAKIINTKPVVTFAKAATGRYRVTFYYRPGAVSLLKRTVPSPMRRWVCDLKHWEVSAEWVGPLHFALFADGYRTTGLDETNIEEWFGWCSTPPPPTKKGRRAHLEGLCVTCATEPHRPGGIECGRCFHLRLCRQHRVRMVLATRGLAPYPEAWVGESCVPLDVDQSGAPIMNRRQRRAAKTVPPDASETCSTASRSAAWPPSFTG